MNHILFVALLLSYSGTTHASEQVTTVQDSVSNSFIWTDSLIAARGPFAVTPPYDIGQRPYVNAKPYILGSVFVLPGTGPYVLTEKSGS